MENRFDSCGSVLQIQLQNREGGGYSIHFTDTMPWGIRKMDIDFDIMFFVKRILFLTFCFFLF